MSESMMHLIPFTQFVLPDGKRKQIEFETENKEVADLAHALIEKGVKFEIEILTTGLINVEAMFNDECIADGLCANGPPVVETVEKMVRRASEVINGNS